MKILVCLHKYLYFIPIIVCFDKKFTLQEYLLYVRYKVLTVLLLKIHIRDVTLCHQASGSQSFEGFECFCIKEQLVQDLILDSETVKNKAGRHLSTITAPHTRILVSAALVSSVQIPFSFHFIYLVFQQSTKVDMELVNK